MINMKTTARNGKVVAIKTVQHSDELMMITANGIIIRTGLDQIRSIGRNTQGVRLIKLKPGDKLVAVEKISPENAGDSQKDLTDPKSNSKPKAKKKVVRKSKKKTGKSTR